MQKASTTTQPHDLSLSIRRDAEVIRRSITRRDSHLKHRISEVESKVISSATLEYEGRSFNSSCRVRTVRSNGIEIQYRLIRDSEIVLIEDYLVL